MAPPTPKASGALRTIGELSADTGLPHHVLRYWETRFPMLRPLTRAGNRRYYRPDDVALVAPHRRAADREGYTIRGVQQLLAAEGQGACPAPDHVRSDRDPRRAGRRAGGGRGRVAPTARASP